MIFAMIIFMPIKSLINPILFVFKIRYLIIVYEFRI